MSYDKHDEHLNQTPFGKLQSQYWTTKQQVIKKLGKKEDEFVVASDATLDAKLELFEAIEQNSLELLKVIDAYQERVILIAIEEAEMSRFLKSHSTYKQESGNKANKTGKMMAAVAKALMFSSQQRTALRLPLVRLFNEMDTFRTQAIRGDCFLTVDKMEKARTEYRGSLLWMRNVSAELDPDTSKKLEKFRQVQARVKKTKTKFDRMKNDVIQKIDLLSASRCNMFSHVLVNYLQTVTSYWEKTARTMNTVAEAYKDVQFYEFNIIKDLRDLNSKESVKESDKSSSVATSESKNSESGENKQQETSSILLDLDSENTAANLVNETSEEDKVEALLDLMTLNEAKNLNEQLKELEQLELVKKQRASATTSSNTISAALDGLVKNHPATSTRQNDASLFSTDSSNLKSFSDILNQANDDFEKEWQSVFNHSSSTSQVNPSTSINTTSLLGLDSPNKPASENLFSSLFSTQLSAKQPESQAAAAATSSSIQESSKSNKNWFDLFAELDPLKNPDQIGNDGTQEERNC